jgi:hypothetical protein
LLVLERIFKIFQCIFTLLLLPPLGEEQYPLYEKKKLGIIPPKDDLCQVSLKLAQWFWRRFLNDPIPFL